MVFLDAKGGRLRAFGQARRAGCGVADRAVYDLAALDARQGQVERSFAENAVNECAAAKGTVLREPAPRARLGECSHGDASAVDPGEHAARSVVGVGVDGPELLTANRGNAGARGQCAKRRTGEPRTAIELGDVRAERARGEARGGRLGRDVAGVDGVVAEDGGRRRRVAHEEVPLGVVSGVPADPREAAARDLLGHGAYAHLVVVGAAQECLRIAVAEAGELTTIVGREGRGDLHRAWRADLERWRSFEGLAGGPEQTTRRAHGLLGGLEVLDLRDLRGARGGCRRGRQGEDERTGDQAVEPGRLHGGLPTSAPKVCK